MNVFKRFLFQSNPKLQLKRLIDAKPILRNNEYIVNVRFDDGKESNYHGIWLRDHCKCHQCYHQLTKQRLLDTANIPIDIQPLKVKVIDNILRISWPDGHESVFESKWLHGNAYYPQLKYDKSPQKFWGKDLIKELPVVSYDEVMDETQDGLAKWLNNIDSFGIGFVDNVPANTIDTERLARRIAFIKETHYGGFYDFTSNLEHGDTAYTNLALSVHTDTTYYTEPMGLQGFHLLHHHGQGGESLFVDGFNVANSLFHISPWAYEILSTQRISAHSIGDSTVFMQQMPPSGYPILNHDPITGNLFQIRFNNTDRSPLRPIGPEKVQVFYKALQEWINLLKSPEYNLQIKLVPGRFVMFNNWRVLHGRSSFTGSRRLTGCYIGMDDFQSRLKIINKKSKSSI